MISYLNLLAWEEIYRSGFIIELLELIRLSLARQIQDASLGGSSDDEDFLGVLRGPSTFANAFLYVGLGTVALGLVIAFVGTGEKGFKTVELRLIGPSLIGNIVLERYSIIIDILICFLFNHRTGPDLLHFTHPLLHLPITLHLIQQEDAQEKWQQDRCGSHNVPAPQ